MKAYRAARRLGVGRGDVLRGWGRRNATTVPVGLVDEWASAPPAWLTAARRRKQRRHQLNREDQRLCPPEIAQLLGLPRKRVLAAMRAAGVCTPLDKAAVRGWLASCARPMPDWLSELLAQTAVEAAEQQARAEAEAVEAEHRRLLVEERVRETLLAGRHHFRGEALEVVEQWAFYASKELLYSGGDVDELQAAALKAVGVNPKDHTTWLLHHGGCDGLGTTGGCDGRIAEMAAERFVAQESDRHQRRERARRDAELITSGAFVVGQPVLAYYDSRAAVLVKLNKVTVQVRHIGWKVNGYQCVERNYSPADLHNLSARLVGKAGTIAVGQRIEFTDWGGRQRVGEILQTDGPLLQVGYQLASGQTRTAWIDVRRLDPAGGQ
jgi:hypothetical protein